MGITIYDDIKINEMKDKVLEEATAIITNMQENDEDVNKQLWIDFSYLTFDLQCAINDFYSNDLEYLKNQKNIISRRISTLKKAQNKADLKRRKNNG